MRELSQNELDMVSGAKPLSFFSSYVLAQNGYEAFTAIGVGTAISIFCLLPSLEAFTIAACTKLVYESLIQSLCGYYLASFMPLKLKSENGNGNGQGNCNVIYFAPH